MPTCATGNDDAESLTFVTRADWMIILCDCHKCANKAWICLSDIRGEIIILCVSFKI